MSGRDGDRATVVATTSSAGGISFGGLLTVLFIAFKLAGVIDWPWWWVLAPVWISGGLVLLLLIAATIVVVVTDLTGNRARERRWRERTGRPQPHQHGPAHRWGRQP